ncbi:hypothetical protein Pcinc_009051 [Petrolisthes cinctipes]|uniref:Peroxisomal membrane protein 11C n=1 Tax=Petrolisthes cinctipes TaxID=88211 RepID=A0AAE1G7M6_PETCI|nr:hypothetical protein Pcinc_009051 [Petrolisthes cinctipes]
MGLQDVVSVLETYRGRAKVMRTVQYGLLLTTPIASHTSKAALQTLSSQIGTARLILRLFDDLPMLHHALQVYFYSKGKDQVVRCLDVMTTMADQLFFPMEHIAWARDIKVLKGNSSYFWHASLLLWGLSLVLSILRSLRVIFLLKRKKEIASTEEEKDEQIQSELLTVIMQSADLLNALNWLPRRPWTKPFPVWQIGLLGMISSSIGFGKLLVHLRSSKKWRIVHPAVTMEYQGVNKGDIMKVYHHRTSS